MVGENGQSRHLNSVPHKGNRCWFGTPCQPGFGMAKPGWNKNHGCCPCPSQGNDLSEIPIPEMSRHYRCRSCSSKKDACNGTPFPGSNADHRPGNGDNQPI